jgi:hypothetical protein
MVIDSQIDSFGCPEKDSSKTHFESPLHAGDMQNGNIGAI